MNSQVHGHPWKFALAMVRNWESGPPRTYHQIDWIGEPGSRHLTRRWMNGTRHDHSNTACGDGLFQVPTSGCLDSHSKDPQQFLRPIGFIEPCKGSVRKSLARRGMVSRDNDDRSLRPKDSAKAKEISPLQSGHVPIRNDGIQHPIEHAFQRFIPVPRKMDLVLCLFEQVGQQVPIAHVIFRNKNFFTAIPIVYSSVSGNLVLRNACVAACTILDVLSGP